MNRNMHTTTVPAVQASSVDLTPTAFLTLRKRRPWVSKNILCTGLSREHSGFLMGGEESLSVSLGICPEDKMSKTGLGYRRHSAGWQKAVCGILDTHLMMYCHWLQPSPFGKRALDRLLFFSLALMCTVPWVRRERLVCARWQVLGLVRGSMVLQGPCRGEVLWSQQQGTQTWEPCWSFPPAPPPRLEQKGDGD